MSNSERKGHDGNFGNVNWIKTKMGIVIFSIKTQKNGQRVGILCSRLIFEVLERASSL